jgi:hypothetical protein
VPDIRASSKVPDGLSPSVISETDLVDQLMERDPQQPVETTLRTDARVIARVTDGIYRQPGSALRELISNSYDADARRVTIHTDRPRFQRMVIEDDGIGMSPQALAHLLYHIGGSAKRTISGIELGITDSDDPNRSPGGRPLIGKIGIGLFSVAQLTQGFQVITKMAGDDKRTVASVLLRQYSEQIQDNSDAEYEAGKVLVWREPASDIEAHGTTIVLDAIRPQTRETLRSTDLWEAVYGTTDEANGYPRVKPPKYHIGSVQPNDEDLLRGGTGYYSLPWSRSDTPLQAFDQLVESVWNAVHEGIPNPRLESLFDYYLRMIWQLSLWCPLPYVDVHPFDLTSADNISAYKLLNDGREKELHLADGEPVRIAANLGNAVRSPKDFVITIDDLELRRPIRMQNLPTTSSAVKTPLLFVANEFLPFDGVDVQLSGGALSFQAYLLWAPKIAPTDHQGVLIRMHDATGSFFDPTFLRFPVSEQRRLTQITCEIFITEGFDGAINIDRESFNYANPHVVALTKWLHAALRRVIAIQKRIASAALRERRAKGAEEAEDAADLIVNNLWRNRRNDDGTEPPGVLFTDEGDSPADTDDAYAFPRRQVIGSFSGPNSQLRQAQIEARLTKICQILAAYDLLDSLSVDEQANMLEAIRQVLQAYEP